MSFYPQSVSTTLPASSKGGFALVIALSLMSFVLLLVLSLSTLLQVENRTASTSAGQLEARLNAQLGAMIALGDLQRYTGPDQRVTARSDILLAPGEIGLAGQERWTGVWSAKDSDPNVPGYQFDFLDQADGLEDHKARWLVSGENPDVFAPVGGTTVALATVGRSVIDKSNNGTDDTVRVETEAILGSGNNVSGRYAYWVSDEGIKARVNLADPHLESSDPDALYYRNAMAQVADPTAVSNYEGNQILSATNSRWKQASLDPASITSVKNIPMFLGSDLGNAKPDGVNREFFHDFTVHSSGVLANVKDGGLKRDLSTALLKLPDDLENELLFEPDNETPSAGDPGGPTWEQLSDYFKLAQSGSLISEDAVQFRMPTNEQVGIAPVVTGWNFLFFPFAAYRSGVLDESGIPLDEWLQSSYEYSLGVFPLITLWNPYDYDLVLPQIGLECEFRTDAVIRVGNKDSTTNTCTLSRMAKQQGGVVNRWALRFVIEAVTIPAGKAINFTPPINSYYDRDDPTENVLKPGAHGELVNGFFSAPVVGSGSLDFYHKNGAKADWMVRQFPSVTTLSLVNDSGEDQGLYRQVVNLYDLSDSEEFDDTGLNLFKALSFRGMPSSIKNMNIWTTRLNKAFNGKTVDLTAFPQNFSDVVQAKGSSVGANYSNLPGIDYTDLGTWNLGNHICGVSASMKFPLVEYDETNELPTHLTYNQNFTTPIYSQSLRSQYTYNNKNRYELYTRGPVVQWNDRSKSRNYLSGTDDTFSKVGLSNDFKGVDSAIFYKIPEERILGVGQLMHANLSNVGKISNGLLNGNGTATWDTNRQQAYLTPLYAIGNSNYDFDIALDETKDYLTKTVNGNNAIGVNYDYSYELNTALWDRFFLSGFDGTTNPLPHSRLHFWKANTGLSDLIDERTAASNLLNLGAFNVNSTSVAAWESILGAMREVDVLGSAQVQDINQKHNFSRFTEPLVDATDTLPDTIGGDLEESEKELLVGGFRSLTDLQIKELAQAIVDEIKLRASALRDDQVRFPYLSLADFVNRSLDHLDDSFKYRGVLQAAIDKTSINGVKEGNTGLWDVTNLEFVPNFAEDNLNLEKRPIGEGLSAFFMQADLLNKIGNLLHARSDTFTIRSYGSAQNGMSDAADSQAYYEITVQRLPTYVEDDLDSFELPDPASLSLNNYFGRRYKIVSERWVNADSI
ncbi:MAG: hypothetical protein GWO81_01120 [Verrucomicrobia bacterium]|nr:hypothetical protein [Verrucomicrobiota bacterium]